MLIIEHLVVRIGIYKAVGLRSVSKSFNAAIMSAICISQVVDINDPATTPDLTQKMPPPLKGEILLIKSRSLKTTEDKGVAVLAKVNEALDLLTLPTEEQKEERHRLIAEAIACMYPDYQRQSECWLEQYTDAEIEAQNLLSGAIVLGNLPLVQFLLESSTPTLARVNSRSPYFGLPLPIAAAWGHLHIVRYLIDRGADPCLWHGNLGEHNPLTFTKLYLSSYIYRHPSGSALRAAILGGHEEIVRFLLDPEYQIPHEREWDRSIIAGVRGGHLHLCQLLIQIAVHSRSEVNYEMLQEAAIHNQQAVIQILLDDGVNINTRGRSRTCALFLAASQGCVSMVRFLLDHGANASLYDDVIGEPVQGEPVQGAAQGGHLEVVKILLEHGANPIGAFEDAVEEGQARLVEWLLTTDVDLIKKEGNYGYTVGVYALLRAIVLKNPRIISLLVHAGVPLAGAQYASWDLPIVVAKRTPGDWIAEFLLSLGAEDQKVKEDEEEKCYRGPFFCGFFLDEDLKEEILSEENVGWQIASGLVRVTKRTWEWVGKY